MSEWGADTDALCGRDVDWDLGPEVNDHTVSNDGICADCHHAFQEDT